MICTRYDANPFADPCPGCAEKSLVCAETYIGYDDMYCCYDTVEEAREQAEKANRTGWLEGERVIRKSAFVLIPRKG